MIYIQVTKSMFRDEFHRAGRGDQFSYEALGGMYDYLEEISEQCPDVDFEMDVVGLCCQYVESTIKEALESYGIATLDEFREQTTIIWEDEENVLYEQF